MSPTGPIDYARFRAAGERGSAPFIAISDRDFAASGQPLMIYLAFRVDDDETREHFEDIENQVATIYEMNHGVYDELIPELKDYERDDG